ncbi:conjugal transfer protein TraC [Candidatus Nomurabacteria bacterium RIFCSPHIGHO2_02_FULL_33_12]|uniref:Conjugal transfer protein TraC n=1 Tax=Candidatus Nomurabacteria bacterium RIFCSPLOWO2_01_FULL_33_17 TaxID=1801764 RepID=A0A1F6WR41_9BACT|nr:MAG: conjugal transfer protein TraC [Candidatus Nomurabacteria bacterium RIFCSPHIGHO2_02_FULL_33_12]OGI84316.1 MAG: conjugal transfer protein TraC [Candidatus Nomurabacteria bacterium RIFCSPLOWO2_01_FULL_33_17]
MNLKSLSIRPEDIYTSATLELQDIIAPSALQILPTALNLGDMIVRSFYVVGYPSILTDNWLTPIINLDRVFNISININPIDTGKILSQFQKKVAEVQSQIATRESKGMVRDPMLESAYRDLESLRDGLQQAQEKMFEVGVYISIYAENETELFKAENEIKGQLDSQMVFLKPATFQQDVAFLSSIPLGVDNLRVVQKMNTEPLSSTFPFVSFDLTGNKGILYGINQHNNSLIIFDRFSLENYNSVTFAKSGSGKSFATKLEILRSLMFDTEVIVIDPEREYEYLSDAVGGRYFDISLSSDHHINPFDLPIPTKDETGKDVLRQNTINLVGLFRVMLGGLTPEEDSVIDRAITETYALKDITEESDFAKIEPPLLSDMAVVLAGMDGADSILRKLEKYTTGSWNGFINKPTNVDINRKFVVFSIRDMEDELKPVAMYIVTHFIWNAIRKNLRKRLMVVDEAWWMMKNDDTASFLYSIAKRGRKYYLGLATITQDVEDFLKSPYGRPILTNSSMQLLLKQSPTTIDVLRDAFNLTDAEKYTLLEANVGEGIFFAGLRHVAIKIVSSYTEEQIITSDPAQVLAIQAQKEGLNT